MFHESESVALRHGITLWGACVRETIIEGNSPNEYDAVITSIYPDTEVRNLQITGQQIGVWVSGTSTSFQVEDAVIRQTALVGIIVVQGQTTLRNVVVRNTQSSQSDGMFGRGPGVESGAEVDVVRSIFKNNRELGIIAEGAGTKVNLIDVTVRNTQSQQSDGTGGTGLNAQSGAEVDVVRSIFKNNRDIGVLAAGAGTKLTLQDVSISDTQSRQSDGTGGRGLVAQLGAYAKVIRSLIKNNREVGVFAGGAETEIKMKDIIISNTLKRQCECEGGIGNGIGSYGWAKIEMERFVVTENEFIGVQIAHGRKGDIKFEISGEMDLNNGISLTIR